MSQVLRITREKFMAFLNEFVYEVMKFQMRSFKWNYKWNEITKYEQTKIDLNLNHSNINSNINCVDKFKSWN